MKILIVEENPDDLSLARRELEAVGHEVTGAANGTLAMRLYQEASPDVVITDIYVPGMDGFALTRAVQQLAAPRWQPVIFLTACRDDDLQVKALQVGADAFIIKPVVAEVLEAKLHVIQRLLAMQRQAEERAYELECYYVAEEEDKRMARQLIERMVSAEKLDDPAISHWISPAAAFCGDLVAAARTPSGTLHVLLADGTGHGLAASINVLPILSPFYRMTEKGFEIDAIVREINIRTRQSLPTERFVAATMASIDFKGGVVRVWNGGNPEPFMLDPTGRVDRIFSRSQVPLGVLPDSGFDAGIESHAFGGHSQLVLYSDGLIEAEDAGGQPFGYDRLAEIFVGNPPGQRLAAVIEAVKAHLGNAAAHDDISALLVDCDHRMDAYPQRSAPMRQVAGQTGNRWNFRLRIGAREIRHIDLVPLLLGVIGEFESIRGNTGRLFVVLSELFNNALDHGLLGLDSSLKLGQDGMEQYLAERDRRLAVLDSGEFEISLEELDENGEPWLRVGCRDSGPGFDHAAVISGIAMEGEMPFGRGIPLVLSMCDSLEFNEAGNAVTLLMPLGGDPG